MFYDKMRLSALPSVIGLKVTLTGLLSSHRTMYAGAAINLLIL